MGLRRNANTLDQPFTKNEIVVAAEDLPGVPAHSSGKVKMVSGFSWKRYWVFFDNGVQMGSLDSDQLVRPQDWENFLAAKAAREATAAAAAEAAAAGEAAGADTTAATTAGADDDSPATRMRAMVPPHLLERSASARTRLEA